MENISRRNFLQRSTAAVAAFTIAPSSILGKSHGYQAPSDKLNIVSVGAGGRPASVINGCNTENIIGLCDVDATRLGATAGKYPGAKTYKDWRKMYDELGKTMDAVIVGTPDHVHAIASSHAITLGKHVYCEKPLTHSVYESRLLTALSAKYKVATQMGNQGSSQAGVRQICDWIADGQVGEITRVECGTNRPAVYWQQGIATPAQGQWVPETLDWDLFIGPSRMVPYHSLYHPFSWRGWWQWGTGALGDMACHIMHPIFKGLKLGYPTLVQGTSSTLLEDNAPISQRVKLTFPARTQHNTKKVKYPEVEVIWTDGGIYPDIPKGWPEGTRLDAEGPVVFHGTKDTIVCGCYGRNPVLLSGRTPNSPKTQREILNDNHQQDWIRACKENPANRVETASHFGEAGFFNEMVVMGVLATRLQQLGKILTWDGPSMQFTNIGENETIPWSGPEGEEVEVTTTTGDAVTGQSSQRRQRRKVRNAKAFAAELIKHTYRDGWTLPAMP